MNNCTGNTDTCIHCHTVTAVQMIQADLIALDLTIRQLGDAIVEAATLNEMAGVNEHGPGFTATVRSRIAKLDRRMTLVTQLHRLTSRQ